MKELTLTHPVYALDGKELLPAGTTTTKDVIEKLIRSNTLDLPETYLLDHSTIREDLKNFMSQAPYDVIFDDKANAAVLLKLMDKAKSVSPVLESLDYFKQNDFHTYRHMLMVFALSTYFGNTLIPDFEQSFSEIAAGPTHDFGKMNVPMEILTKKDALTREEFTLLRHHTAAGYCLLSYYLKNAEHIAAFVACDHHERLDGSGYPCGIRDLHTFVEIVVVSDVYDALLCPRAYRPTSYDNRSAIELITKMAENKEIGWDIVKVLVSKNRAGKPDFKTVKISSEKRGQEPAGNMYGKVAQA